MVPMAARCSWRLRRSSMAAASVDPTRTAASSSSVTSFSSRAACEASSTAAARRPMTRWRISPAALRVNVVARIDAGSAPAASSAR